MVSTEIDIKQLRENIKRGNFVALARALTLVENDIYPAKELLKSLFINRKIPVIGITGPPGAGKSTLVNAITEEVCKNNKRIAILAIDPTSPFNYGSLLGDRIRMSKHFNHPNVYIRSVATRGSLGGLSARTIEMVDVLRSSNFDLIIIETVGVGQSEVEIAGLADKTILVLVPEAGDEIQHIKSGLMEIAQAFVVNKADREGADVFINKLLGMVRDRHSEIPVFKTVADKNQGISPLFEWILKGEIEINMKKEHLLVEKAFKLIQNNRMQDIDKSRLSAAIKIAQNKEEFNIYSFVEQWL